MKLSQFRQLIREEVRKVVNEASKADDPGAVEDMMNFIVGELKSTASGRNRYDAISNDLQSFNPIINKLAKTNNAVKQAKSAWSKNIRTSEDDVKGQHAAMLALYNALAPEAKKMGVTVSLPASAKTYKGK